MSFIGKNEERQDLLKLLEGSDGHFLAMQCSTDEHYRELCASALKTLFWIRNTLMVFVGIQDPKKSPSHRSEKTRFCLT